jgi:hypothetical protein
VAERQAAEMIILKADLLEFYLHLSREAAAGKRWLIYNQILILQDKNTVRCFAGYHLAEQYIRRRNQLIIRFTIIKLDTLLKTIVGILLQKAIPAFINTNDYLTILNYKIMNTKNLEYLKDSLKYLGFGTQLNESLEKSIKEKSADFELRTSLGHFNRWVHYILFFRRSDATDMYFFNRYQATLKGENLQPDRRQTFYIHKGTGGITAREAFNLLEGRSVYKQLMNKEGVQYNAWLKLDHASQDQYGNSRFRQFNDHYGYELDAVLEGFPVRELKDEEQRKQLLTSLQKGNLQMVHFDQSGGSVKFYIHAQPQFKTIAVFDENMQPVARHRISKGDEADHQAKEAKKGAEIGNSEGLKPQRAGRKKKLKS